MWLVELIQVQEVISCIWISMTSFWQLSDLHWENCWMYDSDVSIVHLCLLLIWVIRCNTFPFWESNMAVTCVIKCQKLVLFSCSFINSLFIPFVVYRLQTLLEHIAFASFWIICRMTLHLKLWTARSWILWQMSCISFRFHLKVKKSFDSFRLLFPL